MKCNFVRERGGDSRLWPASTFIRRNFETANEGAAAEAPRFFPLNNADEGGGEREAMGNHCTAAPTCFERRDRARTTSCAPDTKSIECRYAAIRAQDASVFAEVGGGGGVKGNTEIGKTRHGADWEIFKSRSEREGEP